MALKPDVTKSAVSFIGFVLKTESAADGVRGAIMEFASQLSEVID